MRKNIMSDNTRPRVYGLGLALLVCAALVYAEEVPRLTFAQLVESIRAELELTQKIKSFSGKEVEIQGFIVPAGAPDLSFFLLSRVSSTGNYCCEAPVGQDETVYVFATRGVNLLYDPLRIYKVRGIFEAGLTRNAVHGVSLFRMRQAQVEEAMGAKIIKVEEAQAPDSQK
jgi:hypothetical protein